MRALGWMGWALLVVGCGGGGDEEAGDGAADAQRRPASVELAEACEAHCLTAASGDGCGDSERALDACLRQCDAYADTLPEDCQYDMADLLWCLSGEPHTCPDGQRRGPTIGVPVDDGACPSEALAAGQCMADGWG